MEAVLLNAQWSQCMHGCDADQQADSDSGAKTELLEDFIRGCKNVPDLAADGSLGEHRKHTVLQAQLWSF